MALPEMPLRAAKSAEMLWQCAGGFGGLALAALGCDRAFAGASPAALRPAGPLAPLSPHFSARAHNVIFLYMDGGPSQVDTFDPKPLLQKEADSPSK